MKTITEKSRRGKILQLSVIITLIATMAVFAASCKWTIGVVRGSGDLVTEERAVSGFDELHFSGMGSLIIEQGDKETLTIEADDNIIDLIETDVRGGELHIKFRRGFNVVPTAKMKFFLTVIDLDRIDLSGVGDVDCESFQTDDLEFRISGSGNVDFNIQADTLETRISGLGDIDLEGKVDSHKIRISGSGKYDARELESTECEVEVSGLGSATVNVSEELDISISGAGNVYYLGEPSISQNISGLGRIKSID
jgi:hypothetical protein